MLRASRLAVLARSSAEPNAARLAEVWLPGGQLRCRNAWPIAETLGGDSAEAAIAADTPPRAIANMTARGVIVAVPTT